jgi:hypothetical protein
MLLKFCCVYKNLSRVEIKHRKVDLEQFFQEKVALEEKIGEDAPVNRKADQ